ncbi:hypothetical protein F4821DRAFT_264565 [Hypoxylon rubiginosum]|uniref:Uncharacterized protein n=1 Tax=Hypoxylon rubiginosum TaxID=110542 RepID=A0ACC0CN40_9PEZI|nr:hypothetical protein F4821DRAFT_264565 [Hypoxylon rubiginosum]
MSIPNGVSTTTNAEQSSSAVRYFEVCVNAGEHKVNLGEINISSVTTDDQLFDEIWKAYRGLRGSTWQASLRSWFLKPYDVSFVFFGVLRRHSVGIYRKPLDIPPKKEVDEGRYHYHECPMEVLPPIPGNIFLHYLSHAKRKAVSKNSPSYHNDSTFLDRLPKKLGRSIFTEDAAVPGQSISYGWGIHIIERTSKSALYLTIGLVAIISAAICLATFALTWWASGLDKAIGLGQYAGMVLGLLDAAVYCALQAYCTSLTQGKT